MPNPPPDASPQWCARRRRFLKPALAAVSGGRTRPASHEMKRTASPSPWPQTPARKAANVPPPRSDAAREEASSPYHDKNFDKEKTVILYCASGGRSALAGKVLKDMGYDKVYNVGGFKDW